MQHLDYVVAVSEAGPGLIETRCCDDKHQRLPTRSEGRLDDVEHSAVFMGMKLIDDAARRVQSVVRTIVRGERLEHPALRLVGNRISEDRKVLFQVSSLDDLGSIREAYLRLILDRRRRIDLRAAFAIGKEHISPMPAESAVLPFCWR